MSLGSAIQGFFAGDQIEAEADLINRQASINAAFTDASAEDALLRGDREARDYKRNLDQLVGTQRVGFATQNVEVNSGSAADVQDSTQRLGALDLLTIQNNAYREAWGFEVQSQNIKNEASIKSAGSEEQANAAVAGGFLNLGDSLISLGSSIGKGS